jgi:PAS domain S-box-containing protein
MRLEAGFALSDVQKAFELFREVVIPLMGSKNDLETFRENIIKINHCLAYTIHRFSDWFQAMHERSIMEYSKNLEKKVKQRTAEMMESELQYRRLVEEISEGYLVIRNEVIVFANRAFSQMHGYEVKEVLGKHYWYFVDPDDRDRVADIFEAVKKGREQTQPFDYLRLTKDGHCLPTEMNLKATTYKNRPSIICLCRDITWRIKMEEKLRETERMTYIGQITASLSHEIRNPLSAVKMNLQILSRNPHLKGNDKRRVEISAKEVLRVENILKEILDFAKPVQIRKRNYDINQVVDGCLELLEAKYREKDIRIIRSYDVSIPRAEMDGEKISQVLINLILNAIEASHAQGEIFVRTRLRQDNGNHSMEIQIEDKGTGIPKELQTEIFKPFFTTKSNGTGLGLSIAKRIIEAHEGTINVENNYPKGAIFRVTLPLEIRAWQRY